MSASLKSKLRSARRGDTIIEVMFAITIFCLVAVVSVMAMNLGLVESEGALEAVVARNEINAQAEALRFIHSSYISEKTLPPYSQEVYNKGEKYQQYATLWNTIVQNAISPDQAKDLGILNLADTVTNTDTEGGVREAGCARMYQTQGNNGSLLSRAKAFVLNTRDLSSMRNGEADVGVSYISATTSPAKFAAAELNARILFVRPNDSQTNSTTELTDSLGNFYNRVGLAEGIWVVAVTDGTSAPQYYDFYIESCWYSPNTTAPTALDTVIRLYNPENI